MFVKTDICKSLYQELYQYWKEKEFHAIKCGARKVWLKTNERTYKLFLLGPHHLKKYHKIKQNKIKCSLQHRLFNLWRQYERWVMRLQSLINVLKKVTYWNLTWAGWIRSNTTIQIFIHFNIIHLLRLRLLSDNPIFRFSYPQPTRIFLLSPGTHILHPLDFFWFYPANTKEGIIIDTTFNNLCNVNITSWISLFLTWRVNYYLRF